MQAPGCHSAIKDAQDMEWSMVALLGSSARPAEERPGLEGGWAGEAEGQAAPVLVV